MTYRKCKAPAKKRERSLPLARTDKKGGKNDGPERAIPRTCRPISKCSLTFSQFPRRDDNRSGVIGHPATSHRRGIAPWSECELSSALFLSCGGIKARVRAFARKFRKISGRARDHGWRSRVAYKSALAHYDTDITTGLLRHSEKQITKRREQ